MQLRLPGFLAMRFFPGWTAHQIALALDLSPPSLLTAMPCPRLKKNSEREKERENKNPFFDEPSVWEARKFFVLVCSLSSHRHFFIPLIFGSRFIDS
jgi:hypothetical protein